jgi:hypothetical protein
VDAEAEVEVELELAVFDEEILVAVGAEGHGGIAVGDALEDCGFGRGGFGKCGRGRSEVTQEGVLLALHGFGFG